MSTYYLEIVKDVPKGTLVEKRGELDTFELPMPKVQVKQRSVLSCCSMHDAPYRQYADIENQLEVSKIEP